MTILLFHNRYGSNCSAHIWFERGNGCVDQWFGNSSFISQCKRFFYYSHFPSTLLSFELSASTMAISMPLSFNFANSASVTPLYTESYMHMFERPTFFTMLAAAIR